MPGHTARARARAEHDGQAEVDAAGGVIEAGGTCGYPMRDKRLCSSRAGQGTSHEGFGRCSGHGGNSAYERAKGAWLMGHALAQQMNTTPWEALLAEVRRSAGEVAWLDGKVSEAPDDDALLSSEPGVGFAPWVKMRQEARKHLARVAKMAIDGGVAEKLVSQVTSEAQELARVVIFMLQNKDLGLSEEQIALARSILRREMLALASGQSKVIDGEVEDHGDAGSQQGTQVEG